MLKFILLFFAVFPLYANISVTPKRQALTIEHQDLKSEIDGFNLSFVRFYHDDLYLRSTLGKHWTHSFDYHLYSDDFLRVFLLTPNGQVVQFDHISRKDKSEPINHYESAMGTLKWDKGHGGILELSGHESLHFDEKGRLVKITRNKASLYLDYNKNDELTEIRSGETRVLEFGYKNGNLIEVKNNKERLTYEYGGKFLKLVRKTGKEFYVYQYKDGQISSVASEDDQVEVIRSSDRKVISTNSLLEGAIKYQTSGNVFAKNFVDGTNEKFIYGDNQIEFIDREGRKSKFNTLGDDKFMYNNSNGSEIELSFDEHERITEVSVGNDEKMKLGYDSNSRLSSIEQGKKLATFAYDTEGFLTSASYNNDKYALAYDKNRKLKNISLGTKKVDVSQLLDIKRKRSCSFKALKGQKAKRVDCGNGFKASYGKNNFIESLEIPTSGQMKFEWSPYDTLKKFCRSGCYTFSYDGRGRLAKKTYPISGLIDIEYDSYGQLKKLKAGSVEHEYIYNNQGGLVEIKSPNMSLLVEENQNDKKYIHEFRKEDFSLTVQEERNKYKKIKTIEVGDIELSYKDGGDVTFNKKMIKNIPRRGRPSSFKLDDGNLVYYARDNLKWVYNYSSLGERNWIKKNGKTLKSYHDKWGRVTSLSQEPVKWDEEDRLVSWGKKTYRYDKFSRLIAFSDGQKEVLYEYDARGYLSSRQVRGQDKKLVIWLDNRVLALSNSKGDIEKVFIPDQKDSYIGEIVANRNSDDEVNYLIRGYQLDWDGSVLAVEGHSKRVFGAFGEEVGDIFDFGPGYRGALSDPISGLVFMRSRAYVPDLGLFTTADPIPGILSQPKTLNPHLYAYNNPLDYSDPSGLFPLWGSASEFVADVLTPFTGGVRDPTTGLTPATETTFDVITGTPGDFIPDSKAFGLGGVVYNVGKIGLNTVEAVAVGADALKKGEGGFDVLRKFAAVGVDITSYVGVEIGKTLATMPFEWAATGLKAGLTRTGIGLVAVLSANSVKNAVDEGLQLYNAYEQERNSEKNFKESALSAKKRYIEKMEDALKEGNYIAASRINDELFQYADKISDNDLMGFANDYAVNIIDPATKQIKIEEKRLKELEKVEKKKSKVEEIALTEKIEVEKSLQEDDQLSLSQDISIAQNEMQKDYTDFLRAVEQEKKDQAALQEGFQALAQGAAVAQQQMAAYNSQHNAWVKQQNNHMQAVVASQTRSNKTSLQSYSATSGGYPTVDVFSSYANKGSSTTTPVALQGNATAQNFKGKLSQSGACVVDPNAPQQLRDAACSFGQVMQKNNLARPKMLIPPGGSSEGDYVVFCQVYEAKYKKSNGVTGSFKFTWKPCESLPNPKNSSYYAMFEHPVDYKGKTLYMPFRNDTINKDLKELEAQGLNISYGSMPVRKIYFLQYKDKKVGLTEEEIAWEFKFGRGMRK